jgi:hypothetical protein
VPLTGAGARSNGDEPDRKKQRVSLISHPRQVTAPLASVRRESVSAEQPAKHSTVAAREAEDLQWPWGSKIMLDADAEVVSLTLSQGRLLGEFPVGCSTGTPTSTLATLTVAFNTGAHGVATVSRRSESGSDAGYSRIRITARCPCGAWTGPHGWQRGVFGSAAGAGTDAQASACAPAAAAAVPAPAGWPAIPRAVVSERGGAATAATRRCGWCVSQDAASDRTHGPRRTVANLSFSRTAHGFCLGRQRCTAGSERRLGRQRRS